MNDWAAQRVIICADDFAYNASCSAGIAQLATNGKIHATSVMVLSKRWAQDAALLKPLRSNISVGLHVDWTSEFAIAAGHGMGLGAAMLRSWLPAALGGFDVAAARRVIDAQLDAFEAHWGAPPDHIDGHQHVQQFGGIRQALVQAVLARYPAKKPWLRVSSPFEEEKTVKASVIAAQGASQLIALATQAGIPVRPYLTGIYDFTGGAQAYRSRLNAWLRAAPQGTVLMCHPAVAAEPGDSIGAARVWEFAGLS